MVDKFDIKIDITKAYLIEREKKLLLFILVAGLLLILGVSHVLSAETFRRKIVLNGEWEFAKCHNLDKVVYSDKALAGVWQKIDLPRIQYYKQYRNKCTNQN